MMKSLEGQVAVITGASGGVGSAIARELASRDVTVILVGRKIETLSAAAEGLGKRALCCQADLSNDSDILKLPGYVLEHFDRADILVHCAGVISTGALESSSVGDFDFQYRLNVRAPYLLTQAMLPLLKSSQGQIVFMNSSLWLNARSNVAQYAATKYALKAVADSLRSEVNADSIRVLSVFPGRIAGPMQESSYAASHKPYDPETLLQPFDIAVTVASALALPRTAEITDINIRPFQKPLTRND